MTVVPVPVKSFAPFLLCCFASRRTSEPVVGSIPCSGSFPVRRGGFAKTAQNWTGAGVFVGIPRVSSLPEPKPLHSRHRTDRTGPLPSPTIPYHPLPSPTVCRFRPPAGHHFILILIGYVVLTDRLQSSTVVPAPGMVHVRTYRYRYAASASWAKQKDNACWAPSGRTF
jgi:hypothetical protein